MAIEVTVTDEVREAVDSKLFSSKYWVIKISLKELVKLATKLMKMINTRQNWERYLHEWIVCNMVYRKVKDQPFDLSMIRHEENVLAFETSIILTLEIDTTPSQQTIDEAS